MEFECNTNTALREWDKIKIFCGPDKLGVEDIIKCLLVRFAVVPKHFEIVLKIVIHYKIWIKNK